VKDTVFQQNQFGQTIGIQVENGQPRQAPYRKRMQGNACILEQLNIEKHAYQLFEALSVDNKGASWTYLPYGPFDSYEEFFRWISEITMKNDEMLYAILDIKTQIPIGICGYLRINPEHGSIEVGHLHYSKFLKRTLAATEAMYLMMYHIFEELHYRRYEWKCNSLNEASQKAAMRLGFKFEGIFRQSNVFKGHNRDTAWYSIIDSEWPALKEKFEKWLHPDNFDAQGNQIKKLTEINLLSD
jgi:RimJ/RimL family protein N-acetyltransferase